jgi:hypothetical protein
MPTEPYVFAEWRMRYVGIDYHVDVEGHFYSVPCRFARSEVEVRLTGRTVETLREGRTGRRAMRSQRQAHHRRRSHAIAIAVTRLDHRPYPQGRHLVGPPPRRTASSSWSKVPRACEAFSGRGFYKLACQVNCREPSCSILIISLLRTNNHDLSIS